MSTNDRFVYPFWCFETYVEHDCDNSDHVCDVYVTDRNTGVTYSARSDEGTGDLMAEIVDAWEESVGYLY